MTLSNPTHLQSGSSQVTTEGTMIFIHQVWQSFMIHIPGNSYTTLWFVVVPVFHRLRKKVRRWKTSIEFIRAAFFSNANLIKVTTHLSGASRSRAHEDHLGVAAEPGPCRTRGYQQGCPVRDKELWPVNYPYIPCRYPKKTTNITLTELHSLRPGFHRTGNLSSTCPTSLIASCEPTYDGRYLASLHFAPSFHNDLQTDYLTDRSHWGQHPWWHLSTSGWLHGIIAIYLSWDDLPYRCRW